MSVSLLPNDVKEFANKSYWEQFFASVGQDSFEWYGEYTDLCDILHQFIKSKDLVLHIGCGNSKLTFDLYDFGNIHSITNIDISEVVIKQMKDKSELRPGMTFTLMDVTKMTFEESSFTVVLDKGTLDALAADNSPETISKVIMMFTEINRILKIGGRYICVSLAQPHVIRTALEYFYSEGFMSRVIPLNTINPKFPVFIYVFTKFYKIENIKPILEMCDSKMRPSRYDHIIDVLKDISDILEYAFVRYRIQNSKNFDEDLKLQFYDKKNTGDPRYYVTVADSDIIGAKNQFIVFIVPKGRELDWLFNSYQGRRDLCNQMDLKRLALVTLHRNHTYISMDAIKDEISSKIIELCPVNFNESKISFMTIGTNLDCRTRLAIVDSAISGEFLVEQVIIDNAVFRHLIFTANMNVIQSQIRLIEKTVDSKKKGKKGKKKDIPKDSAKVYKVDIHYLPPSYCGVIISALTLLQNKTDDNIDVTLIGLGGGIIPMFLVRHFKDVHVECIELDKEVAIIAERWFGFSTAQCKIEGMKKDRVTLKIADGLDHLQYLKSQGTKKHMLIIDADCKDLSLGLTGPPPPFITEDMLLIMHDILLDNGVLVMNMVARDLKLREDLLSRLRAIFSIVVTCKLTDDVNEVVIAFPSTHFINEMELTNASEYVEEEMQNFQRKLLMVNDKVKPSDVNLLQKLSVYSSVSAG